MNDLAAIVARDAAWTDWGQPRNAASDRRALLDLLRARSLEAAWAEAEAAMADQFRSGFNGRLLDRKRYDLSVHRLYAGRLDADGNEKYDYQARATLTGIHSIPADGPTPAAALHALAAKLRERQP